MERCERSDPGTRELTIRQSVAVQVAFVLLSLFLVATAYAAASNLVYASTMSAITVVAALGSAAWLALLAFLAWAYVREDDRPPIVASVLGAFLLRHRVWIESSADGPALGYGFGIFGRRVYFARIALASIARVDWSSGQATAMTGRDCDDWHVVVWFDRAGRPDDDLCIIGESGPKGRAEAFGLALVGLLRDAGATLVPKDDGRGFRRSCAASEP